MRVLPHTIQWLHHLEQLSQNKSIAHQLDARLKILLCLCFQVCVISFPKYELFGLTPYIFFLFLFIRLSGLSCWDIFKGILPVIPFIVILGILNPFYDTRPIYYKQGLSISCGWISFINILLKSFLTISASILLIATTGFYAFCQGLRQLKVPSILVTQISLTYRFLIEILEQAYAYQTAFKLRKGMTRPTISQWSNIVGQFLLSCIKKSELIYQSIYARGGDNPQFYQTSVGKLTRTTWVFSITFLFLFIICRAVNIPIWIEQQFLFFGL